MVSHGKYNGWPFTIYKTNKRQIFPVRGGTGGNRLVEMTDRLR